MSTQTIIHAGPYKTGTSAIQKAYALNTLKIYQKQCPLMLPRESYANRLTISDPILAKKIENLCTKINRNNTAIISDEGMFMNNHLVFMEEFNAYVETAYKHLQALNPIVVWYIREPVAWLRALFTEGNYLGKITTTAKDWMTTACSQPHLNPMEQIKTLENFFGKENVIAVPYQSGKSISSFSKILEQTGVPKRFIVEDEILVNQNIYSSKTLTNRSKPEDMAPGSASWKQSSNTKPNPHAEAGCMELANRREELVEAYSQLARRASSNPWNFNAESFNKIGQQLLSRSSKVSMFFETSTPATKSSQLKPAELRRKKEKTPSKIQSLKFLKRVQAFFSAENIAFRILTKSIKPRLTLQNTLR